MSRPARFALHQPVVDGLAIIDGAELHHLRDVMRLREGALVALLASNHTELTGRIEKFEGDRAVVRIQSALSLHQPPSLVLATAVIKGPRMDFLIEKASELGVTELWPMLCSRNVVQAPGGERISRWRRLAVAAAKQSFAPSTMELHEPVQFVDLMGNFANDRRATTAPLKLICTIGAEPIASVIRRTNPRAVVIACGPEGDFADAEMELAQGAGFVRGGLGSNRLRSETAALAAVSVAALLLDESSGGD